MMKTPDEIKKALRICSGKLLDYCDACNYCNWSSDCACNSRMCADALDYIQQLENHIGELTEKVTQLEKERDALLADLRDADMLECAHCAHYVPAGAQCEGEGDCLECDYKNCACNGCYGNSNWKWRGVQEVEYVREF